MLGFEVFRGMSTGLRPDLAGFAIASREARRKEGVLRSSATPNNSKRKKKPTEKKEG